MQLLEYIRLFRKWLWLIILVGLLFAGAGFAFRTSQTPIYETSTKVLVGGISDPNPTRELAEVARNLVSTYAQFVNLRPTLEGTIEAYDLPMSADELERNSRTGIIGDTPILEIFASHPDPEIAAKMANGLAQQLIEISPTDNLSPAQQNQVEFLEGEIARLSAQREVWQARIDEINEDLADPLFRDIPALEAEAASLTSQIIDTAGTVAQLSTTLADIRRQSNFLTIIEEAKVPVDTVGVGRTIITGLGFIIGAMLATGIVVVLDELDQTMKTPLRVQRATDIPVMSSIPSFDAGRKPSGKWLTMRQDPLSKSAESFRRLNTNLMFGEHDKGRVMVVTSADADDGKSLVAANLAVTMATAGMRVLLIDANLRNPVLHEVFDVDDEKGLLHLLTVPNDALENMSEEEMDTYLEGVVHWDTEIPDLHIMSRGSGHYGPELISRLMFRFSHFGRWMEVLQNRLDIDVFLFDTAPCLNSSESLVIAGAYNTDVMLLIESGKTRRESVQEAIEQFELVNNPVMGTVLTKV